MHLFGFYNADRAASVASEPSVSTHPIENHIGCGQLWYGVALLSAPDTWVLHGPSCRCDLSMCFKVILVRELKRWFSNVKRMAALISASTGFVALVRNWYLPIFIRFSPFASMDTEALVTTRNGLKFFLRPKMGDLSILNEILRHELYSQQSPVNATVVDIGAHIGVFAVQASASSDTVICYEPHPRNFELLEKNIAINALNNVKAFRQAVSDARGTKRLSVFEKKSYGHTFYPSNGRDFVNAIDVESVTLADVLSSNGLDRIDFLKMHCEGAELDILTHAPQDVLDRVGIILITYARDGPEIADLLTARGFLVAWGQRGTLRAVNQRRVT